MTEDQAEDLIPLAAQLVACVYDYGLIHRGGRCETSRCSRETSRMDRLIS